MSKKTATPASFAQTAFQRAELEAFRRMLTVSEGTFSLSIVLCNSPALRDHLIEHVTSEMEGIQVTRIAEDTQDIFDLAQRQMPNGRPRAVFIVDMEKALAGQRSERVLQGLNVSREQWRSRHQCPVVFWIAEYVVALLSTRCRDLWSWVSHQFEFVSEQATASAGLQDSYAGNTALARNLDVHEKHFRIAELEQRIADAGDDPQGQLREHVSIWQNELACLRWSLGELDTAMALHKEQERICRQLGNLDGLSRTLGNQALILKDRGDLDGAMALFKEVERICRQLGNVESLAIALANQAAVLAQMGRAREGLPLAEQAHQLAAQHGYAVVANQIEPVVNTMRREAQQGLAAQSDQPKPPAGPSPGANPRS